MYLNKIRLVDKINKGADGNAKGSRLKVTDKIWAERQLTTIGSDTDDNKVNTRILMEAVIGEAAQIP